MAKEKKQPNILIIWGDDIGQSNLSCYSKGVMGYRTPNIDRIAKEGAICTDFMVNKAVLQEDQHLSQDSVLTEQVFRRSVCRLPLRD